MSTISNPPAAAAQAMTLLRAASGSTTSGVATILDQIAISGLTALDMLLVYVTVNGSAGVLDIRRDPSTVIATVLDTPNGNIWGTEIALQPMPGNVIWANRQGGTDSGGVVIDNKGSFVGSATWWTAGFTLDFRTPGVTAGTLTWSWRVYKLAGQ